MFEGWNLQFLQIESKDLLFPSPSPWFHLHFFRGSKLFVRKNFPTSSLLPLNSLLYLKTRWKYFNSFSKRKKKTKTKVSLQLTGFYRIKGSWETWTNSDSAFPKHSLSVCLSVSVSLCLSLVIPWTKQVHLGHQKKEKTRKSECKYEMPMYIIDRHQVLLLMLNKFKRVT